MGNARLTRYIDCGAGSMRTDELPVARKALIFMLNAINEN